VEADADGDADADLRLAYDHQEGRVARHTLDGSGAVVGSEHYLLDRMNPTGYEQVLEQAAALDASPTRSFVLGLSLILQADGSTMRSLLYDGHGTARGLTDATGRLASGQILAYDAFGVRTDGHSSVLTPIQYTGQWFDEVLGQGYHRHRWLIPGVGFGSLDSFEASSYQALDLHKYGYGQQNPLNRIDPSGKVSTTELMVVMGIAGAVVGLAAGTYIGYKKTGRLFSMETLTYALVGAAAGFAIGVLIGGAIGPLVGGGMPAGAMGSLARVASKIVSQIARGNLFHINRKGHIKFGAWFVYGVIAGAGTSFATPNAFDSWITPTALLAMSGEAIGITLWRWAQGRNTAPGRLESLIAFTAGFNVGYFTAENAGDIPQAIQELPDLASDWVDTVQELV
jgi:RHS repeat-associated protein